MPEKVNAADLRDALLCPSGGLDVCDVDPDSTPLYEGNGKQEANERRMALDPELDDLQEQLFALGRKNPDTAPSVLVVLQGMDTSGKGGVLRHVIGMVHPQGVHVHAFKTPTAEERRHHFLWRIRKELPARGMIGIFDRSHYEDVLIQRVEQMAPADEIERRYGVINDFEAEVAASGTAILKCFLHISKDEQHERLMDRLTEPESHWKYNPGDVDARLQWDTYMDAYNIALSRCNTDVAPWYIIPANRKWYRNWAIAKLLVQTLRDLNLSWPPPDFDIEREKQRVAES